MLASGTAPTFFITSARRDSLMSSGMAITLSVHGVHEIENDMLGLLINISRIIGQLDLHLHVTRIKLIVIKHRVAVAVAEWVDGPITPKLPLRPCCTVNNAYATKKTRRKTNSEASSDVRMENEMVKKRTGIGVEFIQLARKIGGFGGDTDM